MTNDIERHNEGGSRVSMLNILQITSCLKYEGIADVEVFECLLESFKLYSDFLRIYHWFLRLKFKSGEPTQTDDRFTKLQPTTLFVEVLAKKELDVCHSLGHHISHLTPHGIHLHGIENGVSISNSVFHKRGLKRRHVFRNVYFSIPKLVEISKTWCQSPYNSLFHNCQMFVSRVISIQCPECSAIYTQKSLHVLKVVACVVIIVSCVPKICC